jgi:hypothetical protein
MKARGTVLVLLLVIVPLAFWLVTIHEVTSILAH